MSTHQSDSQQKQHRTSTPKGVGDTSEIAPIHNQTIQRAQRDPSRLTSGDVLALQRSVGNAAVAQMLNKHGQRDVPSAPPTIQRKLTVGSANDRHEREADVIAQSVQKGSSPPSGTSSQSTSKPHSAIQRAPIGPDGGVVDSETSQTIRRAQGGGRPVDAHIRAPLEQKLNTDLSHARLHVGKQADDLNARVGARAFTTGADVFVQRAEYQPQSTQGRALLYHELTHVHQQTGGGAQSAGAAPIQRVISKNEGSFGTIWEGTGSETEARDYLTGLGTKKTDRGERKKQKTEIKEMTGLLHFAKKETATTTEEERILFRAVLTAERARGMGMPALYAFKAYMLRFPKLFSAAQYKKLLENNQNVVKNFISTGKGKDYQAPTAVIDLYHSHMPDGVDGVIDTFETEVNQIVPKANQLASTSTQTSLIQLRKLTPRVTAGLRAAKDARGNGQFELALYHIKQTQQILEVVWQLYTYGSMQGKSTLSTDKESGEAKRLGGGQISKVYEVSYKPELDPSIRHGVFKQETRTYDSGEAMGAKESGISTVESNFGSRSVASYKVDKLLGVGMTPKTEFGTHKGMGGTVQDWAKGDSPQKAVAVGGFGDMTTYYREFDYSDPELQRQLATLQLLDAITGQVDRHPGNYYVYQGPGGTQVTAIDNDLAFGSNKDVGQLIDPTWNRPLGEDQSRGVPLFVDADVAEQILNTTNKDLKDTIVGMLTEAEVNKTLVRFTKVKSELRKKKRNTARIKTMQQKVDVMSKYAGKFGSRHTEVEMGLDTQIHFYKNQIAKLFSEGALIDRSEWGEKTAKHLTRDNSYFGVLVDSYEMHKMMGKTVPLEDD